MLTNCISVLNFSSQYKTELLTKRSSEKWNSSFILRDAVNIYSISADLSTRMNSEATSANNNSDTFLGFRISASF